MRPERDFVLKAELNSIWRILESDRARAQMLYSKFWNNLKLAESCFRTKILSIILVFVEMTRNLQLLILNDTLFFYKKLPQLWALKVLRSVRVQPWSFLIFLPFERSVSYSQFLIKKRVYIIDPEKEFWSFRVVGLTGLVGRNKNQIPNNHYYLHWRPVGSFQSYTQHQPFSPIQLLWSSGFVWPAHQGPRPSKVSLRPVASACVWSESEGGLVRRVAGSPGVHRTGPVGGEPRRPDQAGWWYLSE